MAGVIGRLRRLAGYTRRLLPHLPLAAAIVGADLLARLRPGSVRIARGARTQGISVIVPERGTPDLLAETLAALEQALLGVAEAQQVIVVVNGAARADYAELQRRWPDYDWQFHDRALGYNGAVEAGLAAAHHGWTYLLNSDMRLAPDALTHVLPYRDTSVFAVTSQIFFTDPARRREETGWSDYHLNLEFAEVYERDPGDLRMARGNLYPGGGSSLCRTDVLRRYVAGSRDFSPFYWEDADWGIRAWSEGWEVVFCPLSQAHHHHRGTVRRHYDEDEVARVIRRNELLFDLRHRWTRRHALRSLQRLALLDRTSRRELRGLGLAWRAFHSRVTTQRARAHGLRFDRITRDRWYGPQREDRRRPRVLLVTPFALFPPAHGGARRVAELVTRLSGEVDFFLLGDEASLYGDASEPWLQHFRGVHLLEGRGDRAGEAPLTLQQRLQRHAWPGLRAGLAAAIARFQPDVVQIEFMELADLAVDRGSGGGPRWLLCLHDVYLGSGSADEDALQRAAIARYDAVVTCSAEDAALLAPQAASLVGNGAVDRRAGYAPSPDGLLLFMGPFRYAQNLHGILAFLDTAWPLLRAEFPDLRLRILGGSESAAVAESDARLRQPGIELISAFVDPAPHLAACSLSLNPQTDIRGSSIKLIESLLAGRVCVSTADGMRGFADAGLQALVGSADIPGMAAAIAPLLRDPAARHRLETADDGLLDRYTWDAMAARQRELYRSLTPEHPP